MIKISVVIGAFNEEKNIGQILQSLSVQKTDKGEEIKNDLFEIIIVDNNSTDKTREVVEKFKKEHPKLNLFLISEKEKGVIPPRRRGFRYAIEKNKDIKTLFLAGTDADIIVNEKWIYSILETFRKTKADSLVGSCYFPKEFWQKVPYLASWFKNIKDVVSVIGKDFIFMEGGNNFAITREMYEKCGGYDICKGKILRSDRDRILGINIKLKGGNFAYLNAPNIISPRRFVFILESLIEKGTYCSPMIDVRDEEGIGEQMKKIDRLAKENKLDTRKYIKNFIKDYLFVPLLVEPKLLFKNKQYFKGVSKKIKKELSKYQLRDYWNNINLVLERAEYLANNFWEEIYKNIKKF